jgi:flagellar hook-associated protein 3 FlgL
MRVSTSELFRQGVVSIHERQADLARIQQQLASGQRILAPSDDPAGAVQALQLDGRLAELDQFERNADAARARLGQTESALDQMGQILTRARELTVQAANATQTNESRAAIGREVRELSESLLAAANVRDPSGEYLFAGYRSAGIPFVRDPAGAVEYLGDQGQRRVALSADRTVAMTDSGAAFMTVPHANGTFAVEPLAGNAGTARVTVMEVADSRAADARSFEIRFTAADAYEIRDADDTVVTTGTYAAGAAIEFEGRRIAFAGSPVAGDGFAVEPAGRTSVFAVLDGLAARLTAPASGPAQTARLAHDLDMAMRDLDHAQEQILSVRTSVGARLNTIDSQGALNEDQALKMQTMLSGIRDLDYAEAISSFQLNQVALQAAQQAYVQLSRLSLFDYLR